MRPLHVDGGVLILCCILFYSQVISAQSKTSEDFKKTVISRDFISEGVATADLNKDGKEDIVVTEMMSNKGFGKPGNCVIFINQGNNNYVAVDSEYLKEIGMISSVVLNDLNGDGWLDIILAGKWMPLSVIYNEAGDFNAERRITTIDNSVGLWNTIELQDVDQDGDQDLVCGNEGLNNLANEFGLKISIPKLAGIFMFISDYKPQSSFRQHYTANVLVGELKLPEGKLDAKWFPPYKAIEMMSLPNTKLIFAVRDMTEHILNYPLIVWGGTFTLWKEDGKTKYRTTENFYSIAERK